jgi:membrane protein
MREKLAAFRQSGVGQFIQKFNDDRGTNLAILLAWGMLNTLLPLLLGSLAVAGFVLRDQQHIDQLTGALFTLLPSEAAGVLRGILEGTQRGAGIAGAISLVLLLLNGSNFFANMESAFDLAYHVEDRNMVVQRLVGLIMLIIVIALMIVATLAYGVGGALAAAPGQLFGAFGISVPGAGLLTAALGVLVALLVALLMFVLMYKILPNKPQGWKQVLPGSALAAVLFVAILQVFPIYLALFGKGFAAYQAFGTFLVLMFWLYLLGVVLVLGAELNAYLEEPGRATALAASQARAQKGQAEVRQEPPGRVAAEATGVGQRGAAEAYPGRPQPAPEAEPVAGGPRPSLGGKLIGFAGLVVAALLLRGQGDEHHEAMA